MGRKQCCEDYRQRYVGRYSRALFQSGLHRGGQRVYGCGEVKAKKQLHTSADIEMANASKPGLSIQSMINKAISAHLKKAPFKGGTKKVRAFLSEEISHPDNFTEIHQWQREGQAESYNLKTQVAKQQKVSAKTRAKAPSRYEGRIPEQRKGERESHGKEAIIASFKHNYPAIYPD